MLWSSNDLLCQEAVLQWFFLCFPDVLPAGLLRKELHLNNSPEIAATKEQIQTAFEKLGFPANVRGETLTLKEFAALADEFAEF